jgi:hypothetical protein
MTLVSGAFIGLDATNNAAQYLFHAWWKAYEAGLYRGTVSKHSGQEDHRGDESILAILTAKRKIPLHTTREHFGSDAATGPDTLFRSGYYSREDGPE